MQTSARPDAALSGRDRFVKNAWYAAMWSTDLAEGSLTAQTVVGEPMVFYRRGDGSPVALYDRCPHRFAPLSFGKLIGNDRLQCGYHGLEFAPSGACVHNPHGNGNIPPTAIARSYAVVERHRLVWVWPGAAPPDPSAIPDFSIIEGTPLEHVAKLDSIRIDANYRLLIDNLLDPSHTSYLHAGSLGNAEMIASVASRVDHTDCTVTIDWASTDVPIPSVLGSLVPDDVRGEFARVDKFSNTRWSAPSSILLQTGVCRPGTPRESGTGYYGVHLLTPETERTTLYLFTGVRWNVLTTDAAQNRRLIDQLSTVRRDVFETQDAAIIEAQQRRIDLSEEPLQPALLAIDAAPVRYARILDAMIENETNHRA
jgi:phenylpropionate dioxygenase-like ring-hydroxylating dioxygenase large terminal subunit